MGVVYKAQDTRLDRPVALKFLPPDLTRNSEARERFVHEAKAASALQHPNICTIHDIDETPDHQLFIVMDCYEGQTLKKMIERGPLPPDQAIDIAIQIAQGLEKAHEQGIVHRDIKPGNIIITHNGTVKILDFGLAKLSGQTIVTKIGSTVGTVAYMSPEQAQSKNVDHRTDIWSLGIVLYEMLTGERPFKSDYEQALVYSILNEKPNPMRSFRNEIPIELENIVQKALEKNLEHRYRHATEMLVDLKSLGEKAGDETPRKQSASERTQPSIAVLPFANLSADPENEYFSDGVSEEIINALTKVNGLHVVARTSAFAFKGKNEDIREIGRKLHVEHVLEGSVRKAGNRLRITAQLIKIADGYHLWSERFDRTMDDIFAIQDEISLSIVEKLKVTLLEDEKGALARRSTENLQAYNLYLQGRYSMLKNTRESLQHAIERFQEAISLSPNYADAYAQMAEAFQLLGLLSYLPVSDAYPKARTCALKAIEIDPTAADAHAILATVKLNYDWDWEGAESAFRRAIELNANNARTRMHYALHLVCFGRMNEALAEMIFAYSLDPLIDRLNLGFVLLRMGRLEEARVEFQKSIEMEPQRAHALWLLGHVDVLQGRCEEGLSEIQRAVSLSGRNIIILSGFGWSNAIAGKRSEALRVLEELHDRSKRELIPAYCSAKIYSALGENDVAFEWLEKAYEERDYSLIYMLYDESLIGLRADPRFEDLLKRMKLSGKS